MEFFKTGIFHFKIPFKANVYHKEESISQKFDFFGIQYYSAPLILMTFSKQIMNSCCFPEEKMTHIPFRFYPEGLFPILEECHQLNKPLYITETGCAANEIDQKEYWQKALHIGSYAVKEGINLKKAFIWTLIDNFEWNSGWNQRFGLYSFDRETKKTELRASGALIKQLLIMNKEMLSKK